MDPALDANLQRLLDRQSIEDTLYRYASTIDGQDWDRLRSVLADDVVGVFDNNAPIHGADALVDWIVSVAGTRDWQHHLLNVYHVDIDGDAASAVTYHTSHQTQVDEPGSVYVIVARYYDTLRRASDGRWLIARKEMQVGWRETRTPG